MRQRMVRIASTVLCLGTLVVSLRSQSDPPATVQIREIHVPRIASPPRLEQFLSGASRGDMKRIDDFRQRHPGHGVPVSRKTSAWIGFDDQNFYAVFVCASPAGQTRARM